MFFTVLWRGLRQALGWFFGLFGYKRDGKYAKCIWGLFATSAAIIVAIAAVVFVWSLGETIYEKHYKEAHCYDPDCYFSEYVSEHVYFHNPYNKEGYVFNSQTGEKTVSHVKWISMPADRKDTLVCFNDGKKRGYFNKYTGKVVVEPKYDHAWIYSEGLACVDEGGRIKFIDSTGKVVIDNKMTYSSHMDAYVFHGGYCVISTDGGEPYGLMNKRGDMVLPQEYNVICRTEDVELWRVRKGDEMAVLGKDLNPVIPFMECSIYIDEGTIEVTMPDHTIRKYDLQGKLINDFYISSVRMLEYEKDEIVYRNNIVNQVDDEITEILEETYHPKATARLRAYVAGDGYEGLMTASGHVVTMPLYKEIEAIGYDLYLCTSTNYDKVIYSPLH